MTPTSRDVEIPSYAKINLGLQVLGKRPDGYHAIHTIFQELEFHDTLYIRPGLKGITLTSNHRTLPLGKRNLIWKAIDLVHQQTGCPNDVAVHIEKKIPIGAGLGGGSSNAAATLQGINRLFRLGLTGEQLSDLGAQLGSDVVFFFYGGTALASGRGERIQMLPDIRPVWVVLVNPGIHISSRWAYKNLNLKLTNSEGMISVLPHLKVMQITELQGLQSRNSLEESVCKKYPVIRAIKRELSEHGAVWSLMSGSGSTVFGIFDDKSVAEYARQRMERPGWLVVLTRTKQRHMSNFC